MDRKKVDIVALNQMKSDGKKITMLTAYDYPSARLLDEAGIDTILVGDSAANVVLGYPDTLPVSMEEMLMLTKAVVRGAEHAFVIGDMPFMSYNITIPEAILNAGRFIKEAGAAAIKLEGGAHMISTLSAIVKAGIPSVGHLGLTPQTASMIGGYRVQGKEALSACNIIEDAMRLEDAGAIMLVLECVPDRVAGMVAQRLDIPVIGIGAGAECDGQVLVLHDMLGFKSAFTSKFVKSYASLSDSIRDAAAAYKKDVEDKTFPDLEHSFEIGDKEFAMLKSIAPHKI